MKYAIWIYTNTRDYGFQDALDILAEEFKAKWQGQGCALTTGTFDVSYFPFEKESAEKFVSKATQLAKTHNVKIIKTRMIEDDDETNKNSVQ